MSDWYIISVDQSTQGTKALLFNMKGALIGRNDLPHKQIINEQGWMSHDAEEIYINTVQAVKNLVEQCKVSKDHIVGIGISNQRETSVIWDRKTKRSLAPAIVWQCPRAQVICEREGIRKKLKMIQARTGLRLSPYFPAAKIAWLLEYVEGAKEKAKKHRLCHGTVDSWLVFRLTNGKSYKTDYSNASRTQLFNIFQLNWDEEICELFGIDVANLPEVVGSDSCFGMTTLEGYFKRPVPIHGVMGDSHAALFGQGCLEPGMIKATYGTGSSIMMNVGASPIISAHGLVTSLAWCKEGAVRYVLEGNLNYTGGIITWLKDDLQMITSPNETERLAQMACQDDELYLVPAFSGLGAPYWDSKARAAMIGMGRATGKAEFIRAGLDCIAYQILDVVEAMEKDTDIRIQTLKVDGGPTRNAYLMQFQSDILGTTVEIPEQEELSGIGAAYMAGIGMEVWDNDVFSLLKRKQYDPRLDSKTRMRKKNGWKMAVKKVLTNNN